MHHVKANFKFLIRHFWYQNIEHYILKSKPYFIILKTSCKTHPWSSSSVVMWSWMVRSFCRTATSMFLQSESNSRSRSTKTLWTALRIPPVSFLRKQALHVLGRKEKNRRCLCCSQESHSRRWMQTGQVPWTRRVKECRVHLLQLTSAPIETKPM